MKKWLVSAVVVTVAFVLAGAPAVIAQPAAAADDQVPLTFMSRNLYLGADLSPVIAAVFQTQEALLEATEATWQDVVATDFPARAKGLAAEIVARRPALVGLQEATLWRSQVPADGPATPATHVEYDFLQSLLVELWKSGAPYIVVAVTVGTDVELPRLAEGPPYQDIRLTDRDAILARADLLFGGMRLSNVRTGLFRTKIQLTSDISVVRGWSSVDVRYRGARFRFVNTHLEAYLDAVRVAQAFELLLGPLATLLPTVAAGDFNSDGNLVIAPRAYSLLRRAGFSDAWETARPGDPGPTCCQEELLANTVSLLDQRIDHVLFRGRFAVLGAAISGDSPEDRVQSGPLLLWPSDHAGMSATLDLAPLIR